jgi:hypothetical protein
MFVFNLSSDEYAVTFPETAAFPELSIVNLSSFAVPFEIANFVALFPLIPTFHSGVVPVLVSKQTLGAAFPFTKIP